MNDQTLAIKMENVLLIYLVYFPGRIKFFHKTNYVVLSKFKTA